MYIYYILYYYLKLKAKTISPDYKIFKVYSMRKSVLQTFEKTCYLNNLKFEVKNYHISRKKKSKQRAFLL